MLQTFKATWIRIWFGSIPLLTKNFGQIQSQKKLQLQKCSSIHWLVKKSVTDI